MGLVLVCSVCAGAEEKELEDRDILAKNAVVIDGTTGRILYGKNSEEKAAMASTTKIMTCIVALENSKMDSIAEVSDSTYGNTKRRKILYERPVICHDARVL